MLANQTMPIVEDQTAPDSNAAQTPSTVTGETMAVESRFGTLEVRPEHILDFPKGLLGFGEYHSFGLAPLPNGQHPQFQALQCLEAPDLAFLVAPFNIQSNAIDEGDLQDACDNLAIDRANLAVFLIVTVRRSEDEASISMNMRAPLFIDVAKQIARQFVLSNSKYSIRQML